jgi:hypothetical protein
MTRKGNNMDIVKVLMVAALFSAAFLFVELHFVHHAPTIQLSNYPTIQLSNYPTIQLSNYPTIQLSNYPTIQLSNYPTIQK